MVLLLACLFLCSSVLASVNDITTHSASFNVKLSQDGQAMEHLLAHDHLNALACAVKAPWHDDITPDVYVSLSAHAYLSFLEYSIEHPPELLPLSCA